MVLGSCGRTRSRSRVSRGGIASSVSTRGRAGFSAGLIPRRFADTIHAGSFLDWASVEPFTGHVPTVRLRVPHPKLARLHPAELADLVEAASHREGEEILEAVRTDVEREADVFEELDTQHQVEFIEAMTDEEAAAVLSRMESDDAADLINDLSEERREDVVALLPRAQRRRVRALLGYDAEHGRRPDESRLHLRVFAGDPGGGVRTDPPFDRLARFDRLDLRDEPTASAEGRGPGRRSASAPSRRRPSPTSRARRSMCVRTPISKRLRG